MKRLFAVVASTMTILLVSCGGGPVRIASPTDGQTFQIPSGYSGYPQQLVVTLDDSDAYSDTQITLVGQEKLPPGLLTCSGGSGTPLVCYVGSPQGSFGFNSQYAVLVKATRGDYTDTRIIYFQQGSSTFGGTQR